jgi:hypothetical protein
MQSGALPHEAGQHIRSLLEEARDTEHKMQVASEEADIDENNALKMMELWMRQEEIKGEIENLENPLIRNLVIKKKYEVLQAKRQKRGHL